MHEELELFNYFNDYHEHFSWTGEVDGEFDTWVSEDIDRYCDDEHDKVYWGGFECK